MLALSLLEQPVTLLSIAILLNLLLPASRVQRMLTHGLLQLGSRLNGEHYSARYLHAAGGALLLCLLPPLAACYWALTVLSPWPALLESLLLWCCLDLGRLSRALPLCLRASSEQQPLARLTLAPLCLRQTDPLSPLGLHKTLAEVAVLRLAADAALLYWYLAGGIYAALLFALLRYAVQAWPRKLVPWRAFGLLPSLLYRIMAWLPFHLLALTLLIYPGSRRAIKAWPLGRLWAYPASGRLLAVAAAGVDAGLGGPRRYTDATDYYPKLGGKNYLNAASTRALLWRLVIALLFWLSLAWTLVLVPLFYG
ncbi:adenosylcobinamide-phosphate synthase [Oceanisphaera litoralis]|uniref:cobalamin biosynthesis protein n=1 Tax=Oceanisphaera litoralis TaxID=225144 RepID=UPI00195E00F0|nr:cobalamin biosynthesis protein [Oceanisphaera litoralis]MBM7456472.1 adenosylcobinamide-phosphate synthase [Oceanisphaera litoralis]